MKPQPYKPPLYHFKDSGICLDQGYAIVGHCPHTTDKLTVQVKDILKNNCIEDFKGKPITEIHSDLGLFVATIINIKRNNSSTIFSEDQKKNLEHIFDVDLNQCGDLENLYWQIAKARVIINETAKSYIGNTQSNIYIFQNDMLVDHGILERLERTNVISLQKQINQNAALKYQQSIEKVVSKLKIFENHEEYKDGNFSNLPDISITLAYQIIKIKATIDQELFETLKES
jgi:hypothetical protein